MKYLNAAVPPQEEKISIVKTKWSGINLLEVSDTGQLTNAENISVSELPILVSAEEAVVNTGFGGHAVPSLGVGETVIKPISLYAFGDDLIEIYRIDGDILVSYYNSSDKTTKTATLMSDVDDSDCYPRTMVQFNVYEGDVLDGDFTKKILIFPDKVSFDYKPDTFLLSSLGEVFPDIRTATVFMSRLFGADDGKIYASGFNDYTNWDFDTADEYFVSNAWSTTTQANTKADGDITGIVAYGGHVVCFKRDFMHQIHNTKNPFRLVDIGAFGAVNEKAYAEVNGKLIFVSNDNVHAYGGGGVSNIGGALNISDYSNVVCCGYKDTFYMHLDKVVYTYNTLNGQWGAFKLSSGVVQFAVTSDNVFAQCENGIIYKIHSGAYGQWTLDTDIMSLGVIAIRRIKRICLVVECAEGVTVDVGLVKDSGVYEKITDSSGKTGMFTIRAAVRMLSGQWHKVRISGDGYAKIHYMSLDVSYGGELYK